MSRQARPGVSTDTPGVLVATFTHPAASPADSFQHRRHRPGDADLSLLVDRTIHPFASTWRRTPQPRADHNPFGSQALDLGDGAAGICVPGLHGISAPQQPGDGGFPEAPKAKAAPKRCDRFKQVGESALARPDQACLTWFVPKATRLGAIHGSRPISASYKVKDPAAKCVRAGRRRRSSASERPRANAAIFRRGRSPTRQTADLIVAGAFGRSRIYAGLFAGVTLDLMHQNRCRR